MDWLALSQSTETKDKDEQQELKQEDIEQQELKQDDIEQQELKHKTRWYRTTGAKT